VALAVFGFLTLAPASQAQSGQSGSASGQSGAQAGHAAHENQGSANRLAGADQTFVMKAAQGGMAEVKLGQLAKDHASSNAVKQFGQQMVDDHGKANDELKSLASQKGITLPGDIDAKHQAT